jgi:hypothetical protein
VKKKLTAVFVLLAVCLSLIVLPQTSFAQTRQWEKLGYSEAAKGTIYLDINSRDRDFESDQVKFNYAVDTEEIQSTAYCTEKKFIGRSRRKVSPKSCATQVMLSILCFKSYGYSNLICCSHSTIACCHSPES